MEIKILNIETRKEETFKEVAKTQEDKEYIFLSFFNGEIKQFSIGNFKII